MSSDVHRSNEVPVETEHDPQIRLYFRGEHCFFQCGRELVNLVRAQPRVEWVQFENLPGFSRGLLLRRAERVKFPPKGLRSLESHFRAGGVSRNAVSISTTRPSSWSSTPCQNDSGTSGCWSRRNRRSSERRSSGSRWRMVSSNTRTRSGEDKAFSSATTSVAVIEPKEPQNIAIVKVIGAGPKGRCASYHCHRQRSVSGSGTAMDDIPPRPADSKSAAREGWAACQLPGSAGSPHVAVPSRARSGGVGDAIFHISTENQPSTASRRLAMISSIVSPWVTQPGKAGTSAQKPPSSATWTMAFTVMPL